jgi:hypothetical protein
MYVIREKMFRLGEDSDITNESGQPVLHVEGKIMSLHSRLILRDPAGREVAQVHRKLAAPAHLQDLQRLLVLRAADRRGAADGPARGAHAVPLGLGPVRFASAGRLGARRDRPLLPAGTGLATRGIRPPAVMDIFLTGATGYLGLAGPVVPVTRKYSQARVLAGCLRPGYAL